MEGKNAELSGQIHFFLILFLPFHIKNMKRTIEDKIEIQKVVLVVMRIIRQRVGKMAVS